MTTPTRPRLGPRTRVALALGAAALLAALGVARTLEPDPRGFGTHERLGLPPCASRLRTGVGCPTCGMTTSWALATRGRPRESWRASPAGCLLAPGSGLLAAWMACSAASGRPRPFRTASGPMAGAVVVASASGLAAWILRTYWSG
ncbi:DUF2752 domain-containing protein [Tautonia plasticadhaerens]|uniref:DUF2752 domain-containing protein n=1 Tax=Tautonia plasticadhaerens TaxID=2527974 RepID=A0A518HCR1_9BACT|nr:DUF2752 domain-containing protein [Tautonia plasticadhaerens]QDV38654.1 hypothetical protein ElP_66090 [Tautonia plasticadhaerens]